MVRESIEALKERLKMVVLMKDDCLELVSQWEETREKQRKRQQSFDLELCIICSFGIVLFLTVLLFMVRWCW